MRHVEHRPHIDAAAEDRVGRGERRDQRLDRRGRGIDARAELREKRLGTFGGVERTRGGDLLPAHRDRLVEQALRLGHRSEEHTSELQSLMRISYAVFCLKKKKKKSNKDDDHLKQTT